MHATARIQGHAPPSPVLLRPVQDVSKFGFPKDMVGTLDYVAPEVFKLTSPEHAKQVGVLLVGPA